MTIIFRSRFFDKSIQKINNFFEKNIWRLGFSK